jgi:hypothetical protein
LALIAGKPRGIVTAAFKTKPQPWDCQPIIVPMEEKLRPGACRNSFPRGKGRVRPDHSTVI